jgi:hypothetical protein
MNNLYVLTDITNKFLLGFIEQLPENWNNISGLNRLTNAKIAKLGWAGHPDHGWLPLTSTILPKCSYPEEWIEGCKGSLKRLLSKTRWEKETSEVYVNVNGNSRIFKITERSKTSLLSVNIAAIADNSLVTNFKFDDGVYETLTSSQVIELYQKVNNYIQQCFDAERNFAETIDSCESVVELLQIKYNSILWPSTTL